MPETIVQKKGLGERLLEQGLIKEEQLKVAIQQARQKGKSLKQAIVDLGVIPEEELLIQLSELLNLSVISNLTEVIDPDIVKLLPEKTARQYTAVPLFKAEDLMIVAMDDPTDIVALDDISGQSRCRVEPVLSRRREILKALDHFYGTGSAMGELVEEAKGEGVEFEEEESKSAEKVEIDAPIVRLVNMIITEAIKQGASDIHVEPEELRLRVRYRVDGLLAEVMAPPKQLQPTILSRLKIMSGMDIAEKRAPQDGRFKVRSESKQFDVRVSSLPTVYGEKIVMRLLDQASIQIKLEQLGFTPEQLTELKRLIHLPYGIILVTGPTGSGKTTTLYAGLQAINSIDKNIVTVEDPVEYHLQGINQVHVRVKAGLTFASALRTILRQDPDIIMIGEMRDTETAETAIRSALTGHLVFSTLHTNDAPSALTRMVDMELPPFLVASSVTAVIAQRLVRTLCPRCKVAYEPTEAVLKELGWHGKRPAHLYRAKGCDECQAGYKGRIGIHELMLLDEELRKQLLARASSDVLKEAAKRGGMKSLYEDGVLKVIQGITTIEEVQRVSLMAEHG